MASRLPAGCACRGPAKWTSPRARRPAARPGAMRAYGAGVRSMAGLVLPLGSTACDTRGPSVDHRMLPPKGCNRLEITTVETLGFCRATFNETQSLVVSVQRVTFNIKKQVNYILSSPHTDSQ